MPAPANVPPAAGLFPATRWTLLLASRARPELRRRALQELIAPRWKALYVLARQRGLAPADAEDAVQSFLERAVDSDLLGRVDPARGRLRAYLRVSFQNHLANLAAEASAAKRGGGQRAVSLDDVEALLRSAAPNPDVLFDRAWALGLLDGALGDLQRELADGARRGPFEILRALFSSGDAAPYEALAAKHAMTVPQLKSFVHRAKARYRALVRTRVAETVIDPADVDDELKAVLAVLSS